MKGNATLAGSVCCALLSATLGSQAMAYEKGDIVLRAGHITVEHNEKTEGFKSGALAGVGIGADNDSGLGLNALYMVDDHVGVELLAATPFRHNLQSKGLAADIDLGHVKHLPPTLSLLYFPAAKNAKFQPYVGGGINYTWIFDEKLSSVARGAGLSGLEVRNSWGWSGRVGFDYAIDDQWSVGVGAWYIDINTKASVKVGGARTEANLELDPMVYMVGVGRTF